MSTSERGYTVVGIEDYTETELDRFGPMTLGEANRRADALCANYEDRNVGAHVAVLDPDGNEVEPT